jgi:hypothetical protein
MSRKLSCVYAQIILHNENQGAIVQVGAETITSRELDKLLINNFKMSQ